MDAVTLVNGSQSQSLNPLDRGLAYGDGVFETIAFRHGQVQLWQGHRQRLTKGLLKLSIATDDAAAAILIKALIADVQSAYRLFSPAQGVLKITLTRGVGGRGYLAIQIPHCTRIVTLVAWPKDRENLSVAGINARLCRHPWSVNAALAGLKHLNRLDQVIARNEWQDDKIHEGIMLDHQGYVISGVMSNVFVEHKGRLLVPLLDQSGITGVMAQEVRIVAQELGIKVVEQRIDIDTLLNANALFMTNSLNSIWPVVSLDASAHNLEQRTWAISSVTLALQKLLATRLSQQPLVGDLC